MAFEDVMLLDQIDRSEAAISTSETQNWLSKIFSKPNSTIRVGTLFSGIGAIETAFKRLKLKKLKF